jgi:hypothetical protein
MHLWLQIVLVVCAALLTAALLSLLVALRRAARQGERVLLAVEQELPLLAADARRLAEAAEALTRETRLEVERIGVMTDRATTVANGVSRVITGLAGLTRAGQVLGLAHVLKTGIEVFVHRLRKQGGDDDHG